VPDVIMSHRPSPPLLHRLGAVERLNMRLLVYRQDEAMSRRIEIQPRACRIIADDRSYGILCLRQTTLMSAFPSSRRVNLWLHWKQWTSGVAGQGRRHDRHNDG
jgi:hypothetical protein